MAMTADVKTRGLRAGIGLVITAVLVAALAWWHPPGLYLWAKAVHIIAVISWMAGMLYLPRLFIYHCEAEPGSRQSETFKVMEWRRRGGVISRSARKWRGKVLKASFRARGPDAAAGPNTRGPYTKASACGRGDKANI